MHGWISLPQSWYIVLLIGCAVLGAVLGGVGTRKNAFPRWLAWSFAYAVFMVLVAYLYESSRMPGPYNIAAWSLFVVPAFFLTLPVLGIPWIIAAALRSAGRSAK